MLISVDSALSVFLTVIGFVLMGIGAITVAQLFVQDLIAKHERQHHRRERQRADTSAGGR